MESCCRMEQRSEGASEVFTRQSKRYARKFKRRGLERVQKLMLAGVRAEQVEGKEVLDIGCGVGALHLTLLQEGAARSTGIDVSEGMIDHARTLAGTLGVGSRAEYVVGDFVEKAAEVQEADITILDKFICCYEDPETLIEASTAKTKKLYALSHPKENLMMEFIFKSQIAMAKLFRWKFHPFWHDWKRIRENIQRRGFALVYSGATPMWQVLVYRRQ
ncbi:MAG TPA: methyltransferase domain-containing protein [Bacteroidota bacterium]|nr:methyltransferase domain-containing protein [Bacteroidota bacterium]